MTDPEPDRETGAWLRRQREQRGWAMTEMGRRLVQAAHDNGDNTVPDAGIMKISAYRWERTGRLSDRYRLHYCRAFGIDPDQFGKPQDSPGTDNTDSPAATASPAPPGVADPLLSAAVAMTYRGMPEPVLGEFALGQEVLMAAHEGSDHAEEYEQHGIGDITSEQLRADVRRLSGQTDTGLPLPVFLDLRRVRNRIYRLLDRRLWPREQTELHFLLGCVNGLMGINACDLGYLDAAEEFLRSGYASAAGIEHRPLQGHLRQMLSGIVYLQGRFEESSELALSGLEFLADGAEAGYLHLCRALAAAAIGDADTARTAVNQGHEARERDFRDDLVNIGGEFAASRATHYAHAGRVLASVPGAEREAAATLEQAISLYDAGPDPGESHWFGGKPRASVQLAVVRLRSGALDGATEALEPALALPAEQRVSEITGLLADVRRELAAPVFHGSPQARNLGERIEAFGREAVTTGLHSLTG